MKDSIDKIARKYLYQMRECVGMREFIASRSWLKLSSEMETFLLGNGYMKYSNMPFIDNGDVKVTFDPKAAEIIHSMGLYLQNWPEFYKK